MCANEIRTLKTVIEGKIIEHDMEFNYLRDKTSKYRKDTEHKFQIYNIIGGIINNFGKQMSVHTKIPIHNSKNKSQLRK